MALKPDIAKAIIFRLGESGTPPEFGLDSFTVGLEPYLSVLENEYLDSILKMGMSTFKLVVGSYGGGKTHFLYCVRDLAWQCRYVVNYVPLSPIECPFDRLDLVYKRIVQNLTCPPSSFESLVNPADKGIEALLRVWYVDVSAKLGGKEERDEYLKGLSGIESTSFLLGTKSAFLAMDEGDEKGFSDITRWLSGEPIENLSRFGITETLTQQTAFRFLRSLLQFTRLIGYSGTVLLFDEAERAVSIVGSKAEKRALDNLRQLIDECGNSRFPSSMVLYAIPDVYQLLDKRGDVYEALKQRLEGIFSTTNPSGVRIDLEQIGMEPTDFLRTVGERLGRLYKRAYGVDINDYAIKRTAEVLADVCYKERYGDIGYRRVFVKTFIQALHSLKSDPRKILNEKLAEALVRGNIKSIEDGDREVSDREEY
jgi:hypothetical protein